jgi:hypothetical protein
VGEASVAANLGIAQIVYTMPGAAMLDRKIPGDFLGVTPVAGAPLWLGGHFRSDDCRRPILRQLPLLGSTAGIGGATTTRAPV